MAALNSEDPTVSEAARGMVDQALPVLKTELESQRDTLAGALEAIAGLKGQQAALKEELEGALESGDTELAAELNEALAALDEQLEGIESALGMDASAAQAALDSLNSSLASFPENAEGLLAAMGSSRPPGAAGFRLEPVSCGSCRPVQCPPPAQRGQERAE